MEMTIPVTLIVKAPNQQIEDQTVKCELSWTISKLKGHLSQVYPSKPAHHEQKLIYSGQLLPDSVVLKDVLRNYDGQNIHTVHLVCAPTKNNDFNQVKTQKMNETSAENLNQQNDLHTSQNNSSTSVNVSQSSNDNVLINRNNVPDFQTVWSNIVQNYPTFPNPNQYAVHTAVMHQVYAQYLNQYMQMYSHQRIPEPQTQEPEPNIQAEPNAEPNEEPDNEENPADRDWLDWFYVLSRLIVLFCIVYFYSSPFRFALVLLLGIGLYLYQTGFFRAPVINNNDVPRPENNNQDIRNSERNGTQRNIVDQRPTMLNIMWTFFVTFFASLIPEIPNAL